MRGYRDGHLTPLRISAADSRIVSDGERLPRGLHLLLLLPPPPREMRAEEKHRHRGGVRGREYQGGSPPYDKIVEGGRRRVTRRREKDEGGRERERERDKKRGRRRRETMSGISGKQRSKDSRRVSVHAKKDRGRSDEGEERPGTKEIAFDFRFRPECLQHDGSARSRRSLARPAGYSHV